MPTKVKQQDSVDNEHDELLHAIEHFAHVLPAQATIRDFVHHNTLHGFEHLKFQDALKTAHKLTGAYGYWPQEKFRECYLKGRIVDRDINTILSKDPDLNADDVIFSCSDDSGLGNSVKRQDVYRIASLFPLKKISSCQLKWQSEESHAFDRIQQDVPENIRKSLLDCIKSDNKLNNKAHPPTFTARLTTTEKHHVKVGGCASEKELIEDLWAACVEVLALNPMLLHPEDLVNLDTERAENIFSHITSHDVLAADDLEEKEESEEAIQQARQQKAWKELSALVQVEKKGVKSKLLGLIKTLTGTDIQPTVLAQDQLKIDAHIKKQSWQQQEALLKTVGEKLTLRGLFKQLTGIDVQDEITPYLLPYLSNWLDEGFAQWHANPEQVKGFYQSWKASAVVDEVGVFAKIPDWKEHIDSLPDSATDTVVAELQRMSIPKKKWGAYITRLALDLPGWSGMFYWRHSKPEYKTPLEKSQIEKNQTETHQPIDMMDYLAVRLVLEHLFVRKLCRKLWLVEANLETIRGYLHRQYAEFFVRYALYNQHLPEYLMNQARQLVDEVVERDSLQAHDYLQMHRLEWQLLADKIWTWQQSPSADSSLAANLTEGLKKDLTKSLVEDKESHRGAHLHHDGWVLFRLAQHLGLNGAVIRELSESQLERIFDCIKTMDEERTGFTLLQAYELHYRDKVFSTITQNQGRGTWASRDTQTPQAQLICCMDDREEGFRRHLEHLNPNIETLGAAAFFGVVMNWKGLNDHDSVVLCPVIVTPVHEVQEVADSNYKKDVEKHQSRVALRTRLREFIHQDSHRSLITTSLLTVLYFPVALMTLMGKTFTPLNWNQLSSCLKKKFEAQAITRINTTESSADSETPSPSPSPTSLPTPENRQLGYSIEEQANIVEAFLQNNGLLTGLSPLVVLMGHYSRNQNNPHTAAYGCGACGGKFSGPNGRVFAAMANNSDVRNVLATRGLEITSDTWFIGAEHDTCNENILWQDIDLIPEKLLNNFEKLKDEMNKACRLSAHERCRKLASAPKNPNNTNALNHIVGRAVDYSQARPELGHATIAVGFVGRRHLSQGTFMDRRCFLISYDASVDPGGAFLERILLSAGPVGAGINLEYYFSSVNNKRYGCGSKIVHNIAGLFGVMEGGSGDLRTGLPKQMIEIHEPMRLQLMVEASTDTLTEIYKRQPSIQELIGNGWILLSAKDPESAKIHTFDPDKGWELWKSPDDFTVTTVEKSQDWYRGEYDHISPALIARVNKESNARGNGVSRV